MRDRVTFVHVADAHLDAPFQGIAAGDERIGRELTEATYRAWERVVDLAIERKVDFLVLAGDAYNSADRSLRAQLRFREQVVRLDAAGISTFVVHGNHDPLGGWSAGLALPESVHTFPAGSVERIEAIAEDGFVCAVYGRSFAKAAETANFAAGYRRDEADTLAVGLLHANVGANADYDPYAPCSLDDLRSAGMDYWALGHIHKHEVLSRDPWAVYAGSPQGLNPKETGAHGCCVVGVTRNGSVSMEHVDLAPVAWAFAEVDASGAADIDEVERLVSQACEEIRTAAGRAAVVRIAITGRSSAHADLAHAGAAGQLHEALRRAEAAREPWLLIDRLEDRTRTPLDLDALRTGQDFAAELLSVADELAASPLVLQKLLDEIADPLAEKGLKDSAPALSAAELLKLARDRALDGLLPEGGEAR